MKIIRLEKDAIWYASEKVFNTFHNILAGNMAEYDILLCAVSKTIKNKKFFSKISYSDFSEHTLCSKTRTYASIGTLLTKRSLLYQRGECGIREYGINLAGLFILYDRLFSTNFVGEFAGSLPHLDMCPVQLVEKKAMRLEEILKKKKEEKSKVSIRMIRKIKNTGLKANQIIPYMINFCNENALETKFYDRNWGGKERGMARNWLGECEREGTDPMKVLGDVCNFWPKFQTALRNDSGNIIQLPKSISFIKFYIYRREIGEWLNIHREDKTRKTIIIREECDQ